MKELQISERQIAGFIRTRRAVRLLRDQTCQAALETPAKGKLQGLRKARQSRIGDFAMYLVRFVDGKGKIQEHFVEDFGTANTLAKSIRQFSNRVSVKKLGQVSRRWDVYLFVPELTEPQVIHRNIRTYVAKLTWSRWDSREHNSVLVCWPSDQPIPTNWISSF